MNRKKIVPLKFDSWHEFGTTNAPAAEFVQPLMSFAKLAIDGSRRKWIAERVTSRVCPCCGSRIAQVEREKYEDETGTEIKYFSCSLCGFWRRRIECGISLPSFLIPSIREFDSSRETPSLSHLSQEISSRPDKLYNMEPYKFERFVGSVFSDFFSCEVHHVGQAGDDGIDLYAIVKDAPFLIQVKRRSQPDAVEGINVVKLLFASAFAQGHQQGAVVTTAQRFSRDARSWTKTPRLSDVGFKIELIDFASLMSMVDCVAKTGAPPPWIAHKQSKVEARFFDDDAWALRSHDGWDVLTRGEGSEAIALIYEHLSLEECTVVSGSRQAIDSVVEQLSVKPLSRILRNSENVCVVTRRNDSDLVKEMALPFGLEDALAMRWAELYPKRVSYCPP